MVVSYKFGSVVVKEFVFLAALFLVYSCASTLSGSIYDEQGNIVRTDNGMMNIVPLDKSKQPVSMSVAIEQDGTYEVTEDLPAGYYFLEALVPGYEITSLRFHAESVEKMDLTLVKTNIKDTSSEPIHTLNKEPQRKEPGKVRLDPPGF